MGILDELRSHFWMRKRETANDRGRRGRMLEVLREGIEGGMRENSPINTGDMTMNRVNTGDGNTILNSATVTIPRYEQNINFRVESSLSDEAEERAWQELKERFGAAVHDHLNSRIVEFWRDNDGVQWGIMRTGDVFYDKGEGPVSICLQVQSKTVLPLADILMTKMLWVRHHPEAIKRIMEKQAQERVGQVVRIPVATGVYRVQDDTNMRLDNAGDNLNIRGTRPAVFNAAGGERYIMDAAGNVDMNEEEGAK